MQHYLWGAIPARLGDEMSGQAMLLLGIAVAHTITLGSTLLASLTFAAAIGGPLLGAVLDRSGRPGKLLAAAIALYAVAIFGIAFSLGHIPVWLSVVFAMLAGFFMPAISGGWSSRLATFTPSSRMARASALDATTFNIAGLAGPALAGLIAAWANAHWAVVVLIVLLAASLPMAWALPHAPLPAPKTTPFIHTLLAGFQIIGRQYALLRITIVSVLSYAGIGMLWVLCPLIGQTAFGNVGYGGLLLSVLSVSALIATLLYSKWGTRFSPDTIAFLTTLLLGAAVLLLLFSSNAPIVILAMALAGAADGPQLAAIFAIRHREAPSHLRSQVFTTGASVKITAAATGAFTAGMLAPVSLPLTITVAAGLQLAAAGVFLLLSRTARLKPKK